MTVSVPFDSKDKIFARDKAFWNNYLKGRPSAPDVFLEWIFHYHHEHHGKLGIVHEVGAGNGLYAANLRSNSQHAIISDIAPDNVALAKDRRGTDGFSYRAARVEGGNGIPDATGTWSLLRT